MSGSRAIGHEIAQGSEDPFSFPKIYLYDTELHEVWAVYRQASLIAGGLIKSGEIVAPESYPEYGFKFLEILAQDVIIELYKINQETEVPQSVCLLRVAHEGEICAWLDRTGRAPLDPEQKVIIMQSIRDIYKEVQLQAEVAEQA